MASPMRSIASGQFMCPCLGEGVEWRKVPNRRPPRSWCFPQTGLVSRRHRAGTDPERDERELGLGAAARVDWSRRGPEGYTHPLRSHPRCLEGKQPVAACPGAWQPRSSLLRASPASEIRRPDPRAPTALAARPTGQAGLARAPIQWEARRPLGGSKPSPSAPRGRSGSSRDGREC